METDYLVVGSGAAGLAFADTLLAETNAHITIVDRHAKPGGHWNDAYPFVALHQPSSFYGVNSLELGSGRRDTQGLNAGLHELASGAEVSAYFQRVMNQRLLPSGRVSYHPFCNYLGISDTGEARFESVISGTVTHVQVRRKLVDAYYFGPKVPSTQAPKFRISPGARVVPPNALVNLWQEFAQRPRHFVILGAGKTAMDTGLWLLDSGAPAEAIRWVMPRDSWLINRVTTQPGLEFFEYSIGGQAAQMGALALAHSEDDLFARLEASGQMLRIYPEHKPTMFHFATMSRSETDILRRIRNVIRMGRVQAVEIDALVLDGGRLFMEPGSIYIDCTASAVEKRPMQPVFQPGKVVLQVVRMPLPTFSAALIAYVEARYESDERKNTLCATTPFPENPLGFARAMLVNIRNQFQWSQDKDLRNWIRESRLDGFGKMIAGIDKGDTEKMALLATLRSNTVAATVNIPQLLVG